MIEYLEYGLTGETIDTSNPNDSTVAEEENADESINTVAKASNEMEIDLRRRTKYRSIQRDNQHWYWKY